MENTEKRQLQNCLPFMRTGTDIQKRICLADRASRSCRNRPRGNIYWQSFSMASSLVGTKKKLLP